MSPDALDYEPYFLIARNYFKLAEMVHLCFTIKKVFLNKTPDPAFPLHTLPPLCQDNPIECTQPEMTAEPPTSDTLNQPALTLQRSASLLKHRAASADGQPQDVVCRWQRFLTVTFLSPHCHSLIPCIQLTDELPLRRHSLSQRSTKQSSQSTAKISGLLRERDCSGSVWLSLPSRLLLR